MQIKAYLHRYSVSPSGFFPRPTQGIFVPSKIAVLKFAAFHCSFGVINSTMVIIPKHYYHYDMVVCLHHIPYKPSFHGKAQLHICLSVNFLSGTLKIKGNEI